MKKEMLLDQYYRDRLPYISERWARQLKYYINFWKTHPTSPEEKVRQVLLSLPVSNYTRNRYLTVLNAVRSWAKKRGLSTSFISTPPLFPNDRGKRPLPPVEYLFKIIDNADRELRPLLIVLKSTLARVGELLELKWEDIDFENRLIFLRTRKTGGRGYKNMIIPLNDEAYETLQKLPRRSEYVFAGQRGSPKMSYRWYALKRACERAGVPQVGFHTFRHWAATSLAREGVSLTTIQALCGHSSIRTTEKYLHAYLGDLREAVEKLERRQ